MKNTFYWLNQGDEPTPITLEPSNDGMVVTMGDNVHTVDGVVGPGRVHLLIDGESLACEIHPRKGGFVVTINGHHVDLDLIDERRYRQHLQRGGGVMDASPEINSPMAGRVVKVMAEPGATVSAGEGLVIIEAMTMENEIKSPRDGVVEAVFVAVDQSVEPGHTLVRFATDEDNAD